MSKISVISGVSGQDGSFLAEFLLSMGYNVHGIIRRSSSFNTQRIDHLMNKPCFKLHYGDLSDSTSIRHIIEKTKPHEFYHLGAQSMVRVSFDIPEYTGDITGLGTLRILEAIKDINPTIRFYFAGSSEMFGSAPPPQDEKTLFQPRSPYGCAKVYGYYTTKNYREAYGIYASCGILFNHESERRGETFVTRKITRALTRIKLGLQSKLELGNLDAKRDWGYAKEYVEAMWLMLQQHEPDDYVIATGKSYSVKEWLSIVADKLELDWNKYVTINPRLFRPSEVDHLEGDSTKAQKILDWHPKVDIYQLADIMIAHDIRLAKQEQAIANI